MATFTFIYKKVFTDMIVTIKVKSKYNTQQAYPEFGFNI